MTLVEWFTDPFALGFQQRALLGGIIAGIMCAVVGTWLVLRGMSFFGDAFTHGIVPGLAAAVALDFNPILGAAVAAGLMLLGIELVTRQTRLGEDTAIGLLFVGMLALGVVILSKTPSYAGSLTTILFGNALGVTASDLVLQVALAAVAVTTALVLYRPLLALAFNEQKAELLGLRPARTHAALLVLIAVAVIGSFQSVGPVWEADPEIWWRDVRTNLQGTMLCSRAVLPHMIQRDTGIILNMDGGGGASGTNIGGSAYGCSKAAIVRFTEGLACELEHIHSSVMTFCINPGFVRTPMTENLIDTAEKRQWQSHVPELMGSDHEVPPDTCAKATLRLLDVACPELNGRTFTVDTDFDAVGRNRKIIQQQNLYVMERKTLATA